MGGVVSELGENGRAKNSQQILSYLRAKTREEKMYPKKTGFPISHMVFFRAKKGNFMPSQKLKNTAVTPVVLDEEDEADISSEQHQQNIYESRVQDILDVPETDWY
ncbi:hypothetical protein L6452_20758 [Arctium lappa]|uniref:Uncharacterized protein n=1 Tax=Arctium lappa TaxID=4217 RepID=A0ACB9BE58_ARCLA|nr:hypothetical protein L6452_20758 [Arctium lappa]